MIVNPKGLAGGLIAMWDEEVTMEEVEAAVRSMHSDKALRPNGFPITFFHHFGDIVKANVF